MIFHQLNISTQYRSSSCLFLNILRLNNQFKDNFAEKAYLTQLTLRSLINICYINTVLMLTFINVCIFCYTQNKNLVNFHYKKNMNFQDVRQYWIFLFYHFTLIRYFLPLSVPLQYAFIALKNNYSYIIKEVHNSLHNTFFAWIIIGRLLCVI